MESTFDIENIEKNLQVNYLTNLIKACEKNSIDKKELEVKLDELINDKKNMKKSVSSQNLTNTESPTSQQKFSDEYLYLKPWTKLTAIHKIIKIKEYVNMLLIDNEEEKKELKENLIEMVKNKMITKKDSVLYDSTKGKIISIPLLQYKNGKYYIKID